MVHLQGLASGNTRMSCPRATKHDVMLVIEEIGYQYLENVPVNTKNRYAPVYAGYSFIGSNPSCFVSVELVHSQTPPMPAWPASLPPFAVTGTGCQCLNPTFAPSKLVKSPLELSPCSQARDGGLSSTPLLTKCLLPCQRGIRQAPWKAYPLTAGTVLPRCCSASFAFKPSAKL